jgi:hypothetical protein
LACTTAAAAAITTPPDAALAPAFVVDAVGALFGSQTHPALLAITTSALNFSPTFVQTCSHSVTRSFGVAKVVARTVSHALNKRSPKIVSTAGSLIRLIASSREKRPLWARETLSVNAREIRSRIV